MTININLEGRMQIPYIPGYVRNSSSKEEKDLEEQNRAYIILDKINYGFIEKLKANQVTIAYLIRGDKGEQEASMLAKSVMAQLKQAREILEENVVGFVNLFDQTGRPVTKEMLEQDAIFKFDVVENISIELANFLTALKAEGVSKKLSLHSTTLQKKITTTNS
ncbi:hypothetical protein F0310_04365 (plasmid) [Borrelia sp. A-FGy1]|uniref:hypothetical protein n=1 Tax=Borrelia sp. A-FGy1 TaxID=2608247 RepID=UPI0015F58646|nr:hypothetical protein [Borrelia sp. A-FGy1]QMU99651.1 hypothetical protein F0310_04365 [Borrelia sp. A-FGy1]